MRDGMPAASPAPQSVDAAYALPKKTLPLSPNRYPPHDFNGDSKLDLLWQIQTTGAVIVWYMDDPTMFDAKYIYQAKGLRGRQVTCVRGR